MRRLLTILSLLCLMTMIHGQGIPLIRNFMANEYGANNINYDIEIDEDGHVIVANFEGLLYYDYAEWRLIHTPGFTRVTVVYKAADNTIWLGGYNYFGKLVRKANGELALQGVGKPGLFRGEVMEIYENDGKLQFVVDNGTIYQVSNDQVTIKRNLDKKTLKMGVLDVVDIDALEKGEKEVTKNDTVLIEPLDHGLQAIVMKNSGIIIADDKNRPLYTITDANGLCSSHIAYAAYDGRGHLWGVTSKGIFVVLIPAVLTHFTSHEGLLGSVFTLESLNGHIYAGTDEGLFRQEGYHFVSVPEIPHACIDLKKSGSGLLAATADGIFRLYSDGRIRRLTFSHAMTLMDDGTFIYSGENDGVYLMDANGQNRKKVCDMEYVKKIVKDKEGTIWALSLYGIVWYKKTSDESFHPYKGAEKSETMYTIAITDGRATIVSAESTTPFPYPLLSYVDDSGVTWLTNNEGKGLYRWKNGKRLNDMKLLLSPLEEIAINTIYTRQNEIWMGNDNELTVINPQVYDHSLHHQPHLYIRSIKLGSDSILWGGFGDMPKELPKLSHKDNDLHFTFSINNPSVARKTMYRYRMNNGKWSSWSPNTSASFVNLSYGHHTFSVQALDALNRLSGITSIKFYIKPPFYHRWYMYLLYLLLLAALIYALSQLRLRRLEREKERLEKIVKERTAEVVRLEKMATAGSLTQGLIDRILNPLNYVNNFTKLSEGLVRDVKANVEDEKEHMDEENYEDTMEVLDMLTVNLRKVGEHGQNTTRTLKAMEEMLKDRSGGIVPMDLLAVIRQDEAMLHEYFKKEIEQYGIKTVFAGTEGQLFINGNADQLSKTIMSLLGNAVYAVVKKAEKQKESKGMMEYAPEIALRIAQNGDTISINIRDNGIGIEETILGKIFDPFFTTKTTSEAAGVGLYLSREIVQNHGGDIHVKSVKDEYSELTITLPVKKS